MRRIGWPPAPCITSPCIAPLLSYSSLPRSLLLLHFMDSCTMCCMLHCKPHSMGRSWTRARKGVAGRVEQRPFNRMLPAITPPSFLLTSRQGREWPGSLAGGLSEVLRSLFSSCSRLLRIWPCSTSVRPENSLADGTPVESALARCHASASPPNPTGSLSPNLHPLAPSLTLCWRLLARCQQGAAEEGLQLDHGGHS